MNNKYKNPSKLSLASIIGLCLIIFLVFSSVFIIPALVGVIKGGFSSLVSPVSDERLSKRFIGVDSVISAVDLEEELLIAGRGGADIKLTIKEIMAGYNDAKNQNVSFHSDCKKVKQALTREGCHRYVTAQKHFPPYVRQKDFDQGKKPEQCVAEVNTYYDFVIADLVEQEQDNSAIDKIKNTKQSELEDCDLYDSEKSALVKNKPMLHLNSAIEKIEQAGSASDQDVILVLTDAVNSIKFENNNKKDEFSKNVQEFIQFVDAEIKASTPLNCDQMKKKSDLILNIQKQIELVTNQSRKNRWQDKLWGYKKSSSRLLLWHRIVLMDEAKTAGCIINNPANQ